MAIDGGWMKVWKTLNAAPFHKSCPVPPQVVVIDGQVKLMKGAHITSWEQLVRFQFVNVVQRWFAAGASTVVVCFDWYDAVPAAKSMTQRARRKHVPDTVVNQFDTLPPTLPANYDVMIANRVFKTKVINLVIHFLPELVKLGEGQTLVIDFDRNPVYFRAGQEPVADESMPPLGEADMKFLRYLKHGNLVFDGIDSDWVIISLIHLERLKQESGRGLRELPQLVAYRIETNVSKKRLVTGESKPARAKEFVHINRLFDVIHQHMQASLARSWARLGPGSRGHEIRLLAFLVCLTGTDFSKPLSQVSPARIWQHLGLVWDSLHRCYDPDTMQLDVARAVDAVVARLYSIVYRKHVADKLPMEAVATRLKRHSTLSATVKARLPEARNAACLLKNANWVLQYWLCPDDGAYPDPFGGDYGYKRNRRGLPAYEDD